MLLTGAKTVGFIYPPQGIPETDDEDLKNIDGRKIYQSINTDSDHYFRSYTFLPKDPKEDFKEWIERMEEDFKSFVINPKK
ncbi:MAG: hypothetical protein J5787_04990 [Alphaproteobacteria bacterium]|nr:hypothetical protein [Alphaproteobacteria bacterium]